MTVWGPDTPILASQVIRQAVVPMAAFYLILMAALGLGLAGLHRRGTGQAATGPNREPAAHGPSRGWAALTWHVLGTAIGGYLLLVAVVTAYYYGIARVGGAFLSSAVTGPALLIGLALPVFAAASWTSQRAHSRHGKPPAATQPPPQ